MLRPALSNNVLKTVILIAWWVVSTTAAVGVCYRDFTISYLATDDTGEDVYLSLLSDWDLDAAFISASNPCLRLKVDLKPFEPGIVVVVVVVVVVVAVAAATATGFVHNIKNPGI